MLFQWRKSNSHAKERLQRQQTVFKAPSRQWSLMAGSHHSSPYH